MILSKKVKSLLAAQGINIGEVLERAGVSRSSFYRFSNGISDIRAESLILILKELGVDIEEAIANRVNECMGNSMRAPSLGEDIEQIFQGLSRPSRIALVNAIVADAKKAQKPSLQAPLSRLVDYKRHLKNRSNNASRGNPR